MQLFSKPMGVGEILDQSFQIYRKHFKVLMLLVLILFGPFYFLQHLLLFNLSVVPIFNEDVVYTWMDDDIFFIGFIILMLLLPVYLLAWLPVTIAAPLHVVHAVVEKRPIQLKEILKKSFSPYWKMVGNTFLFGLVIMAIQFGMTLLTMLVVFVFMFLGVSLGAGFYDLDMMGFDSYGLGMIFTVIFIGLYYLLVFSVYVLYSFFMIRFGYFLPPVIFGEERIGLGRSWRLTEGSFWRIFAVYLVIALVCSVIILGIYGVVLLLFQASLLGQLIATLLTMFVLPLALIPYGLIYFDLRVRNEGVDLERAMMTYERN
ncbi:hypothetical protein P4637_06850 [Halalkalibacterium halodurans]|uniref:BH0728 protein n=1 Tax=Halalkalibacterium halodurans (strain ATCC BAA-125 / DSM 18197 / FERM 7344 / JCM 9153 / C-125) TaxID=272558 RepID=Q9KEX1_HALH5|nr:hypothetical protein [Halalkalibacterium halodurans]MED4080354.1 hypothetical protein [Halalkalibacterium halodurans]MED4084582.1 hypothetical protein [Halalkalibacterium halodurans]MED4104854.1 hypothetical protein [Halalkalibacterium halodurans]MED4109705.1 hypothetical protein [Halalkalibacterium halodurans]MED4122940.1 hypothetical protein [Halalkalibacterium halodurans]